MFHPLTFLNSINYAAPSRNLVTFFPDRANGAIGALLGVNTFAFTYPVNVIQGSKKRPFGVKTKLGWTLAGEYELSHKTMNAN